MSREITITQKLSCLHGNFSDSMSAPAAGVTDDQTTADGIKPVVSVPTTAAGTAIGYGNLVAPGRCMIANLDAVNYLEWGRQVSGTFYPVGKVLPGKCDGPFYIADSVQLYWRANTLACLAQIMILDR